MRKKYEISCLPLTLIQGEYIAPEKIESELSKCKWVGQAFVHGDSMEAFLVSAFLLSSFSTVSSSTFPLTFHLLKI